MSKSFRLWSDRPTFVYGRLFPLEFVMTQEQADRRRLLRFVMLAVLVWGSILAVGAGLYGFDPATGEVHYSPKLLRGVIVETFVLAFLGVWSLALFRRPK